MKKGQWRILEAVFSIVILVSFLILIASSQNLVADRTDVTVMGFEKLRLLDLRGDLRPMASANNASGLNEMIHMSGYNHTVEICNIEGMCNGTRPSNADTFKSTYIVSGRETYDPKEIRLYIFKLGSLGDTTPPAISILSPVNTVYGTPDVWVNVTLSEEGSSVIAEMDGSVNHSLAYSGGEWNYRWQSISEGIHTIRIYANDTWGNMAIAERTFIVDVNPLVVNLISPSNTTYPSGTIWVNVTLSEAGSSVIAEMNGSVNHTLSNSTGNWNYYWSGIPEGTHTIRIYATDAGGLTDSSASVSFTVNTTVISQINEIQCYENGTVWGDCSDLTYGDGIAAVRANCTVDGGSVLNVTFNLTNHPDARTYFNENATSSSGDWWTYDNDDFTINDSGDFSLAVVCHASQNSDSDFVDWSVSWGTLQGELVAPTSATDVTRNEYFNFTSRVSCSSGECGYVQATLDPNMLLAASSGNAVTNVTMNRSNTLSMKLVYQENNGGNVRQVYIPYTSTTDRMASATYAKGMFGAFAYNVACGANYYCGQNEDTGGTIEILENSSARIALRVTADLQSSTYGSTIQYLFIYPDRMISTHNVTFATTNFGRGVASFALGQPNLADNHYLFDNNTAPSGQALTGPMVYSNPSGIDYEEGTSLQSIISGYTNVDFSVWTYNTPPEIVSDDSFAEVDSATEGRGIILQLTATSGTSPGDMDTNVISILKITEDNTADGTEARSYARDYWNHGSLTYAIGSSYTQDFGDINHDGFSEMESAYVMNASASRVKFNISGSDYPRYWPVFKISDYTSSSITVTVLNSTGSYTLTEGTDYNAEFWNSSSSSQIMIVQVFTEITDNTQFDIGVVKSGTIPMDSGEPFYTVTQNPAGHETFSCLANMKAGDSCDTKWTVNATGPVASTWEFFTIYEALNYSADVSDNVTAHVNLTITNT